MQNNAQLHDLPPVDLHVGDAEVAPCMGRDAAMDPAYALKGATGLEHSWLAVLLISCSLLPTMTATDEAL